MTHHEVPLVVASPKVGTDGGVEPDSYTDVVVVERMEADGETWLAFTPTEVSTGHAFWLTEDSARRLFRKSLDVLDG